MSENQSKTEERKLAESLAHEACLNFLLAQKTLRRLDDMVGRDESTLIASSIIVTPEVLAAAVKEADERRDLSVVYPFRNRSAQQAIAETPQPAVCDQNAFDPKNLGAGISWPLPLPAKLSDLANNESLIDGTLIEHVEHSEYTAEHGRANILSIGWNKEKGENWFEIATDSDKAFNGIHTKEAGDPDLTIMPDGAIQYKSPFGPCYTLLPKDYREGTTDDLMLSRAATNRPPFAHKADSISIADLLKANSAQLVAVDSDWRTEERDGRQLTRCFAQNEKGAACMSVVKHTGTPHIFCQRWPHEGYCVAACLLPGDISRRGIACNAPVGEYAKATNPENAQPAPSREPLAILGELRLKCGAVVEREQIVLIDELHAALDREAAKVASQKLKDQGIKDGLLLVKELLPAQSGGLPEAPPTSPQALADFIEKERLKPTAPQFITAYGDGTRDRLDSPVKSLLDLCREFDAIDLSECNRRLEAGEKFDAACDGAMEKRVALGEQIKERLGEIWPEFEGEYDKLLALVKEHKHPLEAVLGAMIMGECEDILYGPVSPQVVRLWRGAARLRVLLS